MRRRSAKTGILRAVPAVTVLVVDDHPGMRALIRTLFELDRPHDVIIEADTARRALELWRAQHPDVILLDELLGTERGLDSVAAPIRAVDSVPIVLFTAFIDDGTRKRAVAAGINECVTQDEVNRLPAIVDQLIQNPDSHH